MRRKRPAVALRSGIASRPSPISRRLREKTRASILLTLGVAGALVATDRDHARAAVPVTPVDTTSAGDTFNGALKPWPGGRSGAPPGRLLGVLLPSPSPARRTISRPARKRRGSRRASQGPRTIERRRQSIESAMRHQLPPGLISNTRHAVAASRGGQSRRTVRPCDARAPASSDHHPALLANSGDNIQASP